jgi:hypothetical protein
MSTPKLVAEAAARAAVSAKAAEDADAAGKLAKQRCETAKAQLKSAKEQTTNLVKATSPVSVGGG